MAAEQNTNLTFQEAGSLQTDALFNDFLSLAGAAIAGAVTREFASDANITLVESEYWTSVLVFTDTGTVLTTGRDVIFPPRFSMMWARNNTAQTLTLKKTGQTGIAVPAGETALIAAGLTDVVAAATGGSGGGSDVLDVATPTNAAGTVTLDFAGLSKYVGAITLGANVTTLAFSNLPGAGKYAEYELHIEQDGTGSRTFAIPASHKALGGSDTAIASAANAVTVLTASTVDNGTTWRYAMQESA